MSSTIPEPAEPAAKAALPDTADAGMDRETLHRRAKLGVVLLAGRTVIQQLIVLVGNVYLARLLGPLEFGAFWIVQFALSFFTLFGDAGFGGALIQKRESATNEELSSVFWAQMLMGVSVVLLVFACAPWAIRIWPALPPGASWMLRALSLSLLLTSMRVIPTILMERELFFGRLSVVDLMLTLSFYGCAVWLARAGHGSNALVAAVLLQGAVGLITAFALRPWLPGFHFSLRLLRPILKFGVAFQAKNIIGFVNGAVMPLYAGRALGPYPLGIVTWSQNTAFFPLKLVEILGRVNFPLLSRLQHDERALARTLEKTIQICGVVTLLFVALFLGLGPTLVRIIYGEKWVPALPTFYVFTVAISIGFVSPIVNGALDAVGKPKVMMRLGMFWTALNWIAVATTMHFAHGALAFSLAYCIHIVVGNGAVILVVKSLIPAARLWPGIRAGLLAAAGATCVGRFVLLPWITGPLTLIAATLLGTLAFLAVLAVFDRSAALELVSLVRRRPKSANGGL
ncbi:MAG TPA: oligosaccharide flippase family protein [Polyangiaceae bacterium]|nr:oligosaccharide flippase family protein [Polyangiaceae bacterium]